MTQEGLVRAYLEGCDTPMHSGFTISNLQTAGSVVLFDERSGCGNYTESHRIELLDILAWVYEGPHHD